MIEIKGLHAGYGRSEIVHGVDLEVRSGEIVALFGANGAGKTTTLAATVGVIPRWRGRVLLDGDDTSRLSIPGLYGRGMAYVPEHRGVFAGLTVEENLRLSSPGMTGKEFRSRFDELATLFPVLAERRIQSAGTLSGGERQQLAIGRALIRRPKVLIIDEMSLGLAPVIVSDLFQALRTVAETGVAMLLVEQHIKLALKYVQRAYVMTKGRIVATGTAEDFLSDPVLVQASYLGEQAIESVERAHDQGPDTDGRGAPPESMALAATVARDQGPAANEKSFGALVALRQRSPRNGPTADGLIGLRKAVRARQTGQDHKESTWAHLS
ncbi:MAG: ABC transporter ATP-binding protein [Actinomycetota bacterium]